MRCQTQRDYRTRMLIEDTNHVKKSRIELGKEPHAAREPRFGHPCPRLFLLFPQKSVMTKKGLHVRRCRVFTEDIGENQKKGLRCS